MPSSAATLGRDPRRPGRRCPNPRDEPGQLAFGFGAPLEVGQVAFALPVEPAQAIGGALAPGARVDVVAVPNALKTQLSGADSPSAVILGQGLVVLTIRTPEGEPLTDAPDAGRGTVVIPPKLGSVVVAIPEARWRSLRGRPELDVLPRPQPGGRAVRSPLAVLRDRPAAAAAPPATWPAAAVEEDGFRTGGRIGGGFELAPLNLELMAEAEREATLENLAALYDAIPGPFQLLSVQTGRSSADHLDAIRPAVDALGERVFRPYAANYHGIADAPSRPPRRTILLVEAAAEAELARTLDLVRRVSEERGLGATDRRRRDRRALADIARSGAIYRLRAGFAEGPEFVTALHLGRRWPAEIRPGWLAGLLAVDGLAAVSMRVRPLSRADAMTFMTTQLRVVRSGERLAAERGEVADVERERLDTTAARRRSVAPAPAGSTCRHRAAPRGTRSRHSVRAPRDGSPRGPQPRRRGRRGDAPRRRGLGRGTAGFHLQLDLRAEPRQREPGRLAPPFRVRAVRARRAPVRAGPDERRADRLDRFAHESHNAIVLGQTGKGKTMFTGAEMARCFMRGIRVMGVDPLGDYRRHRDARRHVPSWRERGSTRLR
jgi:hypothetical protein